MSGAAVQPADPVSFQITLLNGVYHGVHSQFQVFVRGRDLPEVRIQLQRNIAILPFAQADGLNESINGILREMQREISAGAPHPIFSAYRKTVSVIRTSMATRIHDGDLILRH